MSLEKESLKFIRLVIVIATTGLVTLSASAEVRNVNQPNKLQLVMQGLLNDSLLLNQGIFYQDFAKIEQSAKDIANHPTPGIGTMKKVKSHLGTEMVNFKGFDIMVHDTAVKINEAAVKKDIEAVKSAYHELLNGCLSCHIQYKERISKILSNN